MITRLSLNPLKGTLQHQSEQVHYTNSPFRGLGGNKIQRLRLFEYTLYIIILSTALGIPIFTGAYTKFGWEKALLNDWVRLLPFVLIFVVNNYVLVPKLLFREKYPYYILTCVLSVVAVVCLADFLFKLTHFPMPPFEEMKDMIPPHGKMPPPPLFGSAIIAVLMIGFNTGIKSFMRWSEEKISQAEKDKHHLYTELAFLKHQISPHFFMNTLNNIHALVDIDTQEAKNAIIKLSHLMRYLLYESDEQKVSLEKEIHFIESYIELIRLRYDEDNLTIEMEYPGNIETVSVPSFLFLAFIENAFKHGINPRALSLIKISFSLENDRLMFRVINNRCDTAMRQAESSGIGLENVRKRLDLIYNDDYKLNIDSSGNIYEVILTIPIS